MILLYCELYIRRYESKQSAMNEPAGVDCSHIYLSTRDKQLLYESINYLRIEPPVIRISALDTRDSRILTNLIESYKDSRLKVDEFSVLTSAGSTENCCVIETSWFRKKIQTEAYKLIFSSMHSF